LRGQILLRAWQDTGLSEAVDVDVAARRATA